MPANSHHALVLDGSGDHFFACGANEYGQLGTGDVENKLSFIQVNLPVKFVSVCTGVRDHSLGIAQGDGSLWSWGSNFRGKLGQGDSNLAFLSQPTQIAGTSNFSQVSAGNEFSLALDFNGIVWSFGSHGEGQLGLGKGGYQKLSPTQIENLPKIKSISAGCNHAIVLDFSGCAWGFGTNSDGQLGVGDFCSKLGPSEIKNVQNVVEVSAGFNHSLLLDSIGCVYSCGYNYHAQLGHSGTTRVNTPQVIPGLSDITSITAAGNSSIFKNNQDQFFVLGDNRKSQLGISAECEQDITVPLEQENWRGKTIIPGAFHNLVIDELGNLLFYGSLSGSPEVKEGKQGDVIVSCRNPRVQIKRAQNDCE